MQSHADKEIKQVTRVFLAFLLLAISNSLASAQDVTSIFHIVEEDKLDLTDSQLSILDSLQQLGPDVQVHVVGTDPLESDKDMLILGPADYSSFPNNPFGESPQIMSLQRVPLVSPSTIVTNQNFTRFEDIAGSESFLTFAGEDVSGVIFQGDYVISVRPLGDGLQAVFSRTFDEFPEDHMPTDNIPSESIGDPQRIMDFNEALDIDEHTTPVIDILILADQSFLRFTANPELLAIGSVDSVNSIFRNSTIEGIVRLSGFQVLGDTATRNINKTMQELTDLQDGRFDDINTELLAEADVTVMIVGQAFACGKANMILADPVSAFAIVRNDCSIEKFTFAHELMHLMGGRHDVASDSKQDPFPYGHGFSSSTRGWRTVMATRNACNCPRYPAFSSPGIRIGEEDGGNPNKADNSRVAREVMHYFSLLNEQR